MAEVITLFDLPSLTKPNKSWSGNAWKTRMALNFKGLPYRTEWINYIHLQDTLKSYGIPANPEGSFSEWSVPTIKLPDGEYIMDSAAIAQELETRHPTPSLRLNPDLEKQASAAMGQVFMSLIPWLLPAGQNLVAAEDIEWFKEDRARRFGRPADELFSPPTNPEAVWKAAEPGFEAVREVLTKHKVDQGPYVLGSKVSYADFYLVGTTTMIEQAGGRYFGEFMDHAPAELREVHEACREWTRKQD